MKRIITIFLLSIAFNVNAQNFAGKATYKTSRKSSFKFGKNQKGISDKMQEDLRKRMEKMNQKTFILNFDKFTSTYKEDVKLADPKKPSMGGMRVMAVSIGGSGSAGVYYKNTKENRFVNQTEIMGKRFLIKDTLPKQDWVLTTEKKNIGNYTCYKATYTREVENIKMSILNGESKEEKVKETIVTTAWYTPQVPVSNGPDNFQGLPGLILEINDGKRMMVCTEIELTPNNTITIEEPKKGKSVSQKKFDKISREKSKELMEKFKSRRGVDIGNGTTIKFGG